MIYWPVLRRRLVELLPTLPAFDGVQGYDGRPRQNVGVREWVSVGWSTFGPDGGTRGNGLGDSGSFSPGEETVTGMESENGTVMCEIGVWGGDKNVDYEARAFELVDAIDAAIRADKTLGVLPESSTTSVGAEVVAGWDSNGKSTRLILSVDYFVRS